LQTIQKGRDRLSVQLETEEEIEAAQAEEETNNGFFDQDS